MGCITETWERVLHWELNDVFEFAGIDPNVLFLDEDYDYRQDYWSPYS